MIPVNANHATATVYVFAMEQFQLVLSAKVQAIASTVTELAIVNIAEDSMILPTKAQLEAYIADGVSQVKIGEIHGLGRNTVRRLEHRLGLGGTREHGRVKPTGASIMSLRKLGLTFKTIAEMFDTPKNTVKSRLTAWEKRQQVEQKQEMDDGPIEFLPDDHSLVTFMARPFGDVMNDLERK